MSDVYVHGVGIVSTAGTGVGAFERAITDPAFEPKTGLEGPDGTIPGVALCQDFTTKDLLPPLVARRLDRSARLLAVAAREALSKAGDPLPWERGSVGVTAGTTNAGTEALVAILQTVFTAGPEEAPPMQFPSTVANAPASQLGILEKLGGPNLTFAEKQVSGLRAVAEAGSLLDHRQAEAVLAGGVDEAQWLNAEGYDRLGALRRPGRAGMLLGEGAAVALLSLTPAPAGVKVRGWGSASEPALPHTYPQTSRGLVAACRFALERAGLTEQDVELVVSLDNGLAAAAELELDALCRLFGTHRPPVAALATRLGDGAAGGVFRFVAACLACSGGPLPAWDRPVRLASAGFPPPQRRPGVVLVPGLAGGGSCLALVLTGPR